MLPPSVAPWSTRSRVFPQPASRQRNRKGRLASPTRPLTRATFPPSKGADVIGPPLFAVRSPQDATGAPGRLGASRRTRVVAAVVAHDVCRERLLEGAGGALRPAAGALS